VVINPAEGIGGPMARAFITRRTSMAQEDPFTLDLFNNTALSSGLGFGVTAFAGGCTAESDDGDDPDPATPAPALPVAEVAHSTSSTSRAKGENFHLANDRALAKGWKDRARDNIAGHRHRSR
jgi:hypothetical protein